MANKYPQTTIDKMISIAEHYYLCASAPKHKYSRVVFISTFLMLDYIDYYAYFGPFYDEHKEEHTLGTKLYQKDFTGLTSPIEFVLPTLYDALSEKHPEWDMEMIPGSMANQIKITIIP